MPLTKDASRLNQMNELTMDTDRGCGECSRVRVLSDTLVYTVLFLCDVIEVESGSRIDSHMFVVPYPFIVLVPGN